MLDGHGITLKTPEAHRMLTGGLASLVEKSMNLIPPPIIHKHKAGI
jgi:hypothetical protein